MRYLAELKSIIKLFINRVWAIFSHQAKIWTHINGVKIGKVVRDNIKVSVIVPVYNVDQYLRQCLSTVVNQSLTEVEIICVNDSSTDQSQSILDEYAESNTAFTLLKHSKNKGLSAARNTGIEASSGEYIYFLDSDDFLANNDALALMYDVARKDDADEVIGGIIHWHEHTGERYLDWDERYLKEEIRGKKLIDMPQVSCNVIAVNKLIRRSLLEIKSIRFIEGLRKYEDNPFSCKVHVLAKSISILPETMYVYRKGRKNSIMMNEVREDPEYKNIYCHEIFSFIESKLEYHQYRDIYYEMYVRQLILGAVTLSHFSPTERDKVELMKAWASLLNVLPGDLPGVPARFKNILMPVIRGEYDDAWNRIMAWDHAVRQGNW